MEVGYIRGLHVGKHYRSQRESKALYSGPLRHGLLAGGSTEPPQFLGFTALQVAQMFLVLGSCVGPTQEARDFARVAHRVYGHVEGPLLATLELADLQHDLKPHNSSPLNVHYRELQLAILRY